MRAVKVQMDTKTKISIGISNALLLLGLWVGQWSVQTLMLLYVIETWVLLLFHAQRLLALGEANLRSSSKGKKHKGKPIDMKHLKVMQYILTAFFVVHFGFFNIGYVLLLGSAITQWISEDVGLALAVAHIGWLLWSYKKKKDQWIQEDARRETSIVSLMFLPYVRIIPMHVVAVVFIFVIVPKTGASESLGLWSLIVGSIFVGLKYGMDLLSASWDEQGKAEESRLENRGASSSLEANDQGKPSSKGTDTSKRWQEQQGDWMVPEDKIVQMWEKRFENKKQRAVLKRFLEQEAKKWNISKEQLYEQEQYKEQLAQCFEQASGQQSGFFGWAAQGVAQKVMGETLWEQQEQVQHRQRVYWAKKVLNETNA